MRYFGCTAWRLVCATIQSRYAMRYLPTLLLLTIFASTAIAQQDSERGGQNNFGGRPTTISGGLEIGIPIGAFADSWGREIVGLSANMAMPMRLLPIDIGFDFAWGRMGGDKEVVAVNEQVLAVNTGELTINSNIYGYHGLARFKPINGMVSPYVEVLAGFRHFTTRSELRVEGLNEPLREERNSSKFVGSTGWAVGVQVAPTRAFYLEARVERLNSGKVEYVDPRSIVINGNGDVTYQTLKSPTRVANVHLGIGFRF
jgi:hypothetical protein